MTKYRERIEEIKKNYRIQKDEIFRRIKVTTFVQLVTQVADVEGFHDPEACDDEVSAEPDTQRSAFEKLANGEGELGKQANAQEKAPQESDSPFLVLDVRDQDDYEKGHIITAHNFPHTLLSRGDNYQSKEMFAFRSQPGKIVIVYDDDERIAPRVASVLVQRGFDNLFMLSGGLRLATKLFPDGLVSGSDARPSNNFEEEDINNLSIYLDNALQNLSGSSRMSTARSTSSRSTARSSKAPFR